MNKNAFLIFVLSFCLSSMMMAQSTKVDTTINLVIFYPNYSKIDLVCEKMPDKNDANVAFCCEAAFTGQLLQNFSHTNIADNHVCAGVLHKGYVCKANTGGFIWQKSDKWFFVEKDK